MILFIHGFASCGLGDKSRLLCEHFGREHLLTPDLPHEPDAAVALLDGLCDQHNVRLLVGSSLGGFYATCLNGMRALPAVLINPVVHPAALFAQNLGTHERWCDGKPFEITQEHVTQLTALTRPTLRADEDYLVLLQSGDEVLDYRLAEQYYEGKTVLIENGGNHRFGNLHDYLDRITTFARSAGVL